MADYKKHIGKIIITAPMAALGQQLVHPELVRRDRRMKFDHREFLLILV